jgi:hypothetical protein
MRSIIILALPCGMIMPATPSASAAPGSAKWCLNGGGQNVNAGGCVYRTLAQCQQDRIGQGGHCDLKSS